MKFLAGLCPSDWYELQDRYPSTRSYKKRRVPFEINTVNLNSFKDWLQQKGAEILEPEQYEALRFRLRNGLHGVIYGSGSASLWGHDKADEWYEEFGE